MSLRRKALLFVSLTLLGLIVLLSIAVSVIFLNSYAAAEDADARTEMGRLRGVFDHAVDDIAFAAQVWGNGAAEYQFVSDGNAAYRQSNLTQATMRNIQMDVVVFVRKDGQVMFATGTDPTTRALMPAPASLLALLKPGSLLVDDPFNDKPVQGIVALPEGILMVAAHPIAQGNVSAGALIFGRYVTPATVAELSQVSQLPLEVFAFDAPGLPSDVTAAKSQLTPANPIIIQNESDSLLKGYGLVSDVFGKPAAVLHVHITRTVHLLSEGSFVYLIGALVVGGVAFVGSIGFMLDRLVLLRLATLTAGVREIGVRKDPSMRLTFPGSDELSTLASAINQTLEDLQSLLHREERLVKQVEELHIEIDRVKAAKEISEITESDYFQGLSKQADEARRRRNSPDVTPQV